MADNDDGSSDAPTSGELRRRSVMPTSDQGIRLPSGRLARDPVEYNIPSPSRGVEQVPPTAPAPPDGHAAAGEPATATSPGGGPPEPRRRLPVWAWLAMGALVLALVGGGIALALAGGDSPSVAAPSTTPSPTTTTPTSPVALEFGLLGDGIADGEYPALAADHGDRYPAAHQMEEWVWDRVGPGWTVSIVGFEQYDYERDASTVEDSYAYLVSPEGRHFELLQLDTDVVGEARIVSWHEQDRAVRIVFGGSSSGALLDLETGAIDEIEFRGSAGYETFLGAASNGHELWRTAAADYSEERTYLWTTADGWARVLPQRDYFSQDYGIGSLEGGGFVFGIHTSDASGYASARSGPPDRPTFLVYDTASGSATVVEPRYSGPQRYCGVASGPASEKARIYCESGDNGRSYWLGLDGSLVPIDEDPTSLDRLYDATTWTHDPSGLVFTSAVGDEAVYELATADGETLAAAGDEWPRSGVVVTRVSEALPGVFAIETAARGLYLVDAAAGVLVVHSPEFAPGENTRLPATAVFFEQATSPGRGQFFGD